MKTNHEQNINNNSGERGNALIYVLVAIVLFAALSFALMRQSDSNEASSLPAERAELYATQMISYAAQAKSAVDQMLFSGAQIDNLDFTLPGEAGFNTQPPANIYKVYHTEGGGLNHNTSPPEAMNQVSASPPAGWYMGRFNNVEWTKGAGQDVILTAYQIDEAICRNINEKIKNDPTIPQLNDEMQKFLLDTASNEDLTSADCPDCEEYFSLCVMNDAGSAYSFYTIIADQ